MPMPAHLIGKSQVSVTEREHLRKELKRGFTDNQVDVYVQTEQEFFSLWIAQQEAHGRTTAQIEAHFEEITGEALALTKTGFEFARGNASTLVSLGMDGKVLTALMGDMRRSGNVLGPYRTSVRQGRKFIIFKGYPGLRKILTGTRYRLNNPKVIKMGIGIDAARGMAKGAVLVTVIVSVVLNTVSWIFDEQYGWKDFVTNVSSDVVKGAIAAAAYYFTYAGVFAVTSMAVLPLALGVLVSLGVGIGLYALDHNGVLTDKVIDTMVKQYHYWKLVTKDPKSHIRKEIIEFFVQIISDMGNVVTEAVSRELRERLRELERRILIYPRRLF